MPLSLFAYLKNRNLPFFVSIVFSENTKVLVFLQIKRYIKIELNLTLKKFKTFINLHLLHCVIFLYDRL